MSIETGEKVGGSQVAEFSTEKRVERMSEGVCLNKALFLSA
jgi:hypothetical protein